MTADGRWWLLLHNLPPKPPYLRAKVMRRLSQLGALPLKRSAYLLPATEGTLEDFQWLLREIRAEGGAAWIVEASFVGGLQDDEIRQNFRTIRATEYRALAGEARTLLERVRDPGAAPDDASLESERRRLHRRLEAARRLDFFQAEGREEVEALMTAIDRLTERTNKPPAPTLPRDELRARTWVTRKGVKVDRISSAWLIRRFIDPAGAFVFVAAEDSMPVTDGLRFDMFEGEFTHEGDRCTFEVLLEVSGLAADPALAAIAQIVHDIDLREERYQRPETAGVAALIDGIVSRFADDHRRIAEGASMFDTLYASLGSQAAGGGE
ncbi:MAG TPA: chromate resistance protein ChrB domain-containing protein [Vicinamibacterales bacterium]|nr:chromate resistance protein ChrB domain-containing protein [Vicinamibacterales bacterium]